MSSKYYEKVIREIIRENPKLLNRSSDVVRKMKDRKTIAKMGHGKYRYKYPRPRRNIPTVTQTQQILKKISHDLFYEGVSP
jgi:hypothetical protein